MRELLVFSKGFCVISSRSKLHPTSPQMIRRLCARNKPKTNEKNLAPRLKIDIAKKLVEAVYMPEEVGLLLQYINIL